MLGSSDQFGSAQYPPHDPTAWILSQRPPRIPVDPFRPHGFFLEQEPSASGAIVSSACILLTNKECPWRCLMCDLWKHTLSHSVPVGAIPAQIDFALDRLATRPGQVKLYNSGSFFDPAAIPLADYPAIANRLSFASNVVVECHPRLVGEKAIRFRNLLGGSLEVALGLETIHPEVLPRLNKRFTLEHFTHAAAYLRDQGIALRAFVLVKPPFVREEQAVEWAVRSAEFAFSCGASVVSLIPTRPGNGALDQLMAAGEFSPPQLTTLENAFDAALDLKAGRVLVDTWDLEKFSSCSACFEKRHNRLVAMNLGQRVASRVQCVQCGAP